MVKKKKNKDAANAKRLETMENNQPLKKKIAKTFSQRFDTLIKENNCERIWEKIGISNKAYSNYKNGDDSNGKNAKPKFPDLVALYKIKNYFNVPYSYLLGETETKNINNLETGINLGLTDKSISKLVNIYKRKDIPENDFLIYLINYLIINDKFIRRISNFIMNELDNKINNINLNESEEYNIEFQKFILNNSLNSIIFDITKKDDIPIDVIEYIKNKPKNLNLMQYSNEYRKSKNKIEENFKLKNQ